MAKDLPFLQPERVNVLGVGISVLNLADAKRRVLQAAAEPGYCGYVTVTGVHGVMESQDDDALKRIHNRSFLSTPDGMPMVWCGKLAGHEMMGRVYGPDLMWEILSASPMSGLKHYFFGGGDGLAAALKDAVCARIPGLEVVGIHTPPFRPLTEDEESQLLEEVRALQPHYFWVGLSTPKQERFMAGMIERLSQIAATWDHGLVLLGVGAAFDFHAGRVRQAPGWIQRSGMEWAFRLCMEPKRLWRRYFRNNPRFVWGKLMQELDWKQYPPIQ